MTKQLKKDKIEEQVKCIIDRRVQLYKKLYELGLHKDLDKRFVDTFITRCLEYSFDTPVEEVIYKELAKDFQC